MRIAAVSLAFTFFCMMGAQVAATAQESTDFIIGAIDDSVTNPLPASVHPQARPDRDSGRVPSDVAMPRMKLILRRSHEQEALLETLLAAQQDPKSSDYHKWLSPGEFGSRFGVSKNDVAKLEGWLRRDGFAVDEIPAGNWTVVFSGTAAQVETAFRTELHYYTVDGVLHRSNSIPLSIPDAFVELVEGVLGVNDFQPIAGAHRVARPDLLSGSSHILEPSDYAAIYNLSPLYARNIDGTGQTIAVVGPMQH